MTDSLDMWQAIFILSILFFLFIIIVGAIMIVSAKPKRPEVAEWYEEYKKAMDGEGEWTTEMLDRLLDDLEELDD